MRNTVYGRYGPLAWSERPVYSLSLNLTSVGDLVKAQQLELSVLNSQCDHLNVGGLDLNRRIFRYLLMSN